jgi:hypothetical protein
MTYTTEEIQASVENIVLSSIRRPYDTLGVRRTDITFTDTQEAAAGVFLLNRNAPFYVLLLAARRTAEASVNLGQTVQKLMDAISAVGRDVFPVEDLSPLANARAALLELEGAVAGRTKSFGSLQRVPAFVRYENNVNQFLSSAGKAVKSGGQIVQTPQEARSIIPDLVRELEEGHGKLLESVRLVQNGMKDFGDLNLPALVATGVVSRARQMLDQHLDELEVLSPTERLKLVRSVVLDLLSQKGVIKEFGSFQGPSERFYISGTGQAYSDAEHLATVATSVAALPGPYALRTTRNTLDFFLDDVFTPRVLGLVADIDVGVNAYEATIDAASFSGVVPGDVVYVELGANAASRWVVKTVGPTQLVVIGDHTPTTSLGETIEIWPAPSASASLAPSLVAKIEGYLAEPYDIHVAGGGLTATNTLIFKIDAVVVIVSLTVGSARTAAQIVTNINSAIAIQASGKPVQAETYFSPLKYESQVTSASLGGFIYDLTVLAGQLDGLGIQAGDKVKFTSGPDAGVVANVDFVPVGPGITFMQITAPGALSGVGTRQTIQVGAPNLKVRLVCTSPATCLSSLTRLEVVIDAGNTATATLGFGQGLFSQSRKVRVSELVKDFNQRTLAVVASSVTVTDFSGSLRTDPLFSQKVVAYKFSGTVSVAVAGSAITVTGSGFLTAGVEVGDVVVFRTGPDPDEFFTVATVTDTTITGSHAGFSSATDITAEVGENFPLSFVGRTIRVSSGVNAGDYEVTAQGPVPFDFTVNLNFPQYRTLTAQPVVMVGSLGQEFAAFSSRLTTIASRVTVRGSAIDFFYPGLESPLAVGTSPWFKLPEVPLTLQAGDIIETYETQYNQVTQAYEIDSVERALLIVGITPEIPSDESWVFAEQEPPYALLRAGTVTDATGLSTKLTAWLTIPVNEEGYFRDLNRFLNPLLVNANPTLVQVNDALNRVRDMAKVLTKTFATILSADPELSLEGILGSYSASIVGPVDTLIQGFLEKGADRAVDILLSANFSGFFGLSADSSSYAGNMLQTLRSMAREDLPINKFNRKESVQGKLLSSAASDDFEFSSSDIEKTVPVNPPVK